MCKKSFWVKRCEKYIGEKYVQEEFLGEESLSEKYMGEKYVQEEFLGEESLGEKYMGEMYWRVSGWKVWWKIGVDGMLAFVPPFSGCLLLRSMLLGWSLKLACMAESMVSRFTPLIRQLRFKAVAKHHFDPRKILGAQMNLWPHCAALRFTRPDDVFPPW